MTHPRSAALVLTLVLAAVVRADSPAVVPAAVATKADAALQPLLARAKDAQAPREPLRLDLLALRRAFPGTPAAQQAGELLARLPSPLDQLDPAKIDADDRFANQPPELVAVLRGHTRAVSALDFAPDGVTLASGSWDNGVRLWRPKGGAFHEWAALKGSPSGVAFAPDGKTLVTGRPDTLLRLWDVSGATPQEGDTLPGHSHRPFALAFAPNGKMLASGCYGPVLRLWDLRDKEPEAWAALGEEKPARAAASLAFSPDGRLLAVGGLAPGAPLRLWDVGGQVMTELDVPATRARLVAFAPAGRTLAFAGDDAKVRLWDTSTLPPKPGRVLDAHPVEDGFATVRALAFAPGGGLLATAGKDRRVVVWDHATGKPRHAWTLPDTAVALAFAADGRHLAVGGAGSPVYVFRCGPAPK